MSYSDPQIQHEFTYTRRDYLFDLGCLVTFFALWFYVGSQLIKALYSVPPASWFWFVAPVVFFLAMLAADFLSGFVHFVADNFFTPETPLVGRAFIAPFREHHDLPLKITEHSFAELNGNSAFLCLPIMLTLCWMSHRFMHPAVQLLCLFTLMFTVLVVVTNKIHFWAHAKSNPAVVVKLQKLNLILSPERHALHHTFPYEGNYCITLGLLNPILDRLGFFSGIKDLVRRLKRPAP